MLGRVVTRKVNVKFSVIFKTPDAVEYATERLLQDVSNYETREELRQDIKEVTDKYIKYGEYITVEFNTEDKTATVVERK